MNPLVRVFGSIGTSRLIAKIFFNIFSISATVTRSTRTFSSRSTLLSAALTQWVSLMGINEPMHCICPGKNKAFAVNHDFTV